MATKTSGEIEKEFIDNLKGSTGRTLAEWMKRVGGSGISKRNDIIKAEREARLWPYERVSVDIYLNNGRPVYGSTD
ncbi:MAG TPA: hypothetical protein VN476_06985 [Pyrinomonadaceae bacterium]|nr:hypothetical protein [Pyrinomonadaceae bacterium]